MKKTDLEKNKGLKIANQQRHDAGRRPRRGGPGSPSSQGGATLNPLIGRLLKGTLPKE